MQPSKHRPPFEDPLHLVSRGRTKIHSLWLSWFYPFASIGRGVSFHFSSTVSRARSPRISIGNSVAVARNAWLNIPTPDPTGEPLLVIEDGCFIGTETVISALNCIHLERDVAIAQSVIIQDHNHAYEDTAVPIVNQGVTNGGRIRIGQGSWIGHGTAIICPRGELTIGRNCVIAANSMVMRSIPDYSVAAGYPAAVIRQYDPEKRAWRAGGRRSTAAPDAENVPASSSAAQNGN